MGSVKSSSSVDGSGVGRGLVRRRKYFISPSFISLLFFEGLHPCSEARYADADVEAIRSRQDWRSCGERVEEDSRLRVSEEGTGERARFGGFFEEGRRGRGREMVDGKYRARKASRERALPASIIGDRVWVRAGDIMM